MTNIKDIQNQQPENELELEKVGVEGLKKYALITRPGGEYHAIVTINSYITLPPNRRGAHMSRFIESVAEIPAKATSFEGLAEKIAISTMKKHGYHCYTEIFSELPFEREKPDGHKETGIAEMFAEYSTHGRHMVGTSVNGTLACPCSKELCNGLTHNQRGILSVKIDANSVDLFDIIDICQRSFSSPTFSLLKRPEEQTIVEIMHQNPMFVEDVVRKCVQLLKTQYPAKYCVVKCVSLESIHDHNVCSEWRGML